MQDIYNLDEVADTVVSYDQTHVFKGTTSFQIPFGRGKKWLSASHGVVDAILGGWTLTGIFRYASGRPMGVIPAVFETQQVVRNAMNMSADGISVHPLVRCQGFLIFPFSWLRSYSCRRATVTSNWAARRAGR